MNVKYLVGAAINAKYSPVELPPEVLQGLQLEVLEVGPELVLQELEELQQEEAVEAGLEEELLLLVEAVEVGLV